MRNKRKERVGERRKLFSILIVCLLIVNSMGIQALAMDKGVSPGGAAGDAYDKLQNVEAVVMQNGRPVTDSFNYKDPVKIIYNFDIPVVGDDPSPAAPVRGGDIATFDLPGGMLLTNTAQKDMMFNGEKVGAVTFGVTKATVTFTSLIDDMSISNVKGTFDALMKYDSSGDGGNPGEHKVIILGKEYTVIVPEREVLVSGTKTGIVDLENGLVNWTLNINGKYEGGEPASLKGYTFKDDLTNVGEFVPGSMYVGSNPDGSDKVSVTPTINAGLLEYTFTKEHSGMSGFFQTKIPQSLLEQTDKVTLTNKATINKEGKQVAEFVGTVEFRPNWISKTGKVVAGTEGTSGNYDPSNRQIEWTISANNMGQSINSAKVIDVLSNGLGLVSAKVSKGGSGFVPISPNVDGQKLTFDLGDINERVVIKIITRVLNTDATYKELVFVNKATLVGVNIPDFVSNTKTVKVGYNAINKTSAGYNKLDHTILWNVNVDKKGQDFGGTPKSADLIVYGDSIDKSQIDALGTGDLAMSKNEIGGLRPRFNQKYVDNSLTINNGAPSKVYTIMKDGQPIANLVVVYGECSYSLRTEITDSQIYAGNGTQRIYNTATLFVNGKRLTESTGRENLESYVIKKDLKGTFDYNERSLTYRLHVNWNMISMTDVVVKDLLLEGFEYLKNDGKDYKLYEGTPGSKGYLNQGDEVTGSIVPKALINGREFAVNFPVLNRAYVIELKAGPTEAKAEEYFQSNGRYDVINQASLKAGVHKDPIKVSHKYILKTNVVDKGAKLVGAEFTLFSKDGQKPLRAGLTDSMGVLYLKVIPEGEYVLKETKAPLGYILLSKEHKVVVSNTDGKFVTSIDGGDNKVIVVNSTEVVNPPIPDPDPDHKGELAENCDGQSGPNGPSNQPAMDKQAMDKVPITYDNPQIALWVVIVIVSGLILAGFGYSLYRTKKKK